MRIEPPQSQSALEQEEPERSELWLVQTSRGRYADVGGLRQLELTALTEHGLGKD
jgi:hypothetical protein